MYGIAMLYSHRQDSHGRTVQDERALAPDGGLQRLDWTSVFLSFISGHIQAGRISYTLYVVVFSAIPGAISGGTERSGPYPNSRHSHC